MTAPATPATAQDWPARGALTRAVDLVLLALGAGITTGFVHSLALWITHSVFHQLVWVTRDFVWMSPTAYSLVVLATALPFVLLTLFWRSRIVLWGAAFVCASVGALGVLLPYSEISRIAALVLAVGVGVQWARTVTAAPARTLPRMRKRAVAGAGLVVVLAALLPWGRGLAERRALAALPPAANDAPNVLLIILDTVRAASMSLYGDTQATTPRLASWAKDGAVFEWAFSVGPWTLPSHASMFTGKYAGDLSTDWKAPLDRTDSTLAERFAARGYATGGFVANMHYTSWDSGLDRGFARYDDYQTSWGQLWRSTSYTQTVFFGQLLRSRSLGRLARTLLHPDPSIDPKHHFDRKFADAVAQDFLQWEGGIARRERPFFAFLNFFDAHQPYYAPPPYRRFSSGYWGLDTYRASIFYLDAVVDSVLGALRARGALDNTVVVVTSDHGELFGEHELSGHAHNVYRNVLHVPLVIRFPKRIPVSRRVRDVVSLRDVAATVADLAALPGAIPGRSLVPLALGGPSGGVPRPSPVIAEVTQAPNVSPVYPTAHGPLAAAIDSTWYFIRGPGTSEALYRYRTDSLETVNAVADAASAPAASLFRARLDSLARTRRRP